MSKKRICLFLLFSLCVSVNYLTIAQTKPDDKLVYVLKSGALTTFSFNDKFVAVADNMLITDPLPVPQRRELENENNWIVQTEALIDITDSSGNIIEAKGNIVKLRPTTVSVNFPLEEKFFLFEIGRKIDRTKHKITFIYQPNGIPQETLDQTRIKELSTIQIGFADSFPSDSILEKKYWRVRLVRLSDGEETDAPLSNVFIDPDRENRLVTLEIGEVLDRTTHKITIRYLQPNFPEFTIGEPQKTGTKKIYTAAKGKDDADIYFNGKAVGAKNSKPLYSIESKFSYLQSLGRKGAIGGKISADFSEESNLDPDSIIATGTYEKIFLLGPPSTGIRFVTDFLGGEFDRKNKTRNLVSGAYGVLILPSYKFNDNNFATAEFMAGVEAGHNYRNSLVEDGIGNFWRPKFGINIYYLSLHPGPLNRVTVSAEYKIRLPRSAEPFTQIINGDESTFLAKKPRHDYQFSLDFMFSKAFGISVQHRYGSVPPVFKLVDNKVSLGIVFKLKQANK